MFYPDSSIVFFPNGFPRTPEPKCSPFAESNDQPQNIGHAVRFNASEPVQNASKSLKEYRQLHHRVWHRLQNHHLETLNSSPRLSTMRSMTQSRYPRRGLPEAPLSLHIKATNWLPHACNGNLVMAITEVIAGHTILTENHLISLEDLLDSTLIN